MARITVEVLTILRQTASRLEKSAFYQWGHMGSCNCGFLAQEISQLRKDEIHSRAMDRSGDWTEQLNDYCPHSGLRMDDLIQQMIEYGFDVTDLKHLERLSDPNILKSLQGKHLRHNNKNDVIEYLRAWSDIIEEKLILEVSLPRFERTTDVVCH